MKILIGLIAFILMGSGGFCALAGALGKPVNILQQILGDMEIMQGISIFALGLIAFAIACLIHSVQATAKKIGLRLVRTDGDRPADDAGRPGGRPSRG